MSVRARVAAKARSLALRPAAANAYEQLTAPRIGPLAGEGSSGPTITLINDCRDQINYGAQALVDGLLRVVRERLPAATTLTVPSHWLVDRSFALDGFDAHAAGSRALDAVFPVVADQFEQVAEDWLGGNGGPDTTVYIDCLRRSDAVVLNGEGSIYRTNLSAVRELFLAWFAKNHLGIPTAFVNGTLHLTGVLPILPAMVRKAFATLDHVAVREPLSLDNVATFAPTVQATLIPDTAFAITADDARATPALASVRERIGSGSFYAFDPGTMPLDHRERGRSSLYRLLEALAERGGTPVFVETAPADRYTAAIAREVGGVFVDDLPDYREWMALVAEASFVVTGRYHNVILAAVMGCPSIALASTTHKVHGACALLEGIVGSAHDGTDLNNAFGEILGQADSYVADRVALAARLRETSERRRAETVAIGDVVANLLP